MSSVNYDPTLSLNLGSSPATAHISHPHTEQSPDSAFNLSLSLSLSAPTLTTTHTRAQQISNHATSPRSGVSSLSLSNCSAPVAPAPAVTGKRRERDPPVPAASGSASEEVDRNHSSKSAAGSDEEEDELAGGGAHSNVRKKLRLTKDQSALLEESFKLHSTLNPKQKSALAKQLNLRPRQVEVWFQNRRARTKFKQTEVDCEFLKKWCESLTNENRRLQKEVHELRAVKVAAAQQPFYMQLPAATLTMCPSCERVTSTTSTTAAAGSGAEVCRR